MKQGKLFILSGQSGVGKNTILKALIENHPDCHRAVTCTTRERRDGEINGKDHFFIKENDFSEKMKSGYFLECAKVHHWHYGTPLEQITDALKGGKSVFMEIDVQGVAQIKEKMPDAVTIFIKFENGKVEKLIRKRILNDPSRKNVTEDEILKRIESAKNEAEYIKNYDFTVTNPEGHPEKAIEEIEKIITQNI